MRAKALMLLGIILVSWALAGLTIIVLVLGLGPLVIHG